MAYQLNPELAQWLTAHALPLDQSNHHASLVIPKLAEHHLFGLGVPATYGGQAHSDFAEAVWAITAVAKYSLSAAFAYWAQRCFISYLLLDPSRPATAQYLPELLSGQLTGATGLSNAIKFLSGVEDLQVHATPTADGWELNGFLPWVSNVDNDGFVVAVAAQRPQQAPAIFLLQSDDKGLHRQADLDLHCLQGSNTASIHIQSCHVGTDRLLADQAAEFIQQVRPPFLAFQCALSTGVALQSLEQVLAHPRLNTAHATQAQDLQHKLVTTQRHIITGCLNGVFLQQPTELFALRIEIARLCQEACLLELYTEGGASYLQGKREHTLRRVREALFLPLVSPTVQQLRQQLQTPFTFATA